MAVYGKYVYIYQRAVFLSSCIFLFVPEGYWFAVEGLMNTEHLMQQAMVIGNG